MTDHTTCKCGKNPALDWDDFMIIMGEYGSLDKVLSREWKAICKTCNEKFVFTEEYEKTN